MADITHNDPVVTESKLTEFYNDIKPFLGCPAYVTQEGDAEYYSTDEKVVGRWTDGKPLYQKTIYAATATKYLNIQDMTGKELKQLDGVFDNGTAKEVLPYADNGGYVCLVHVLSNNLQVYLNTFSSVTNLYVTIRYTKSADSATTTVEQKPTHYSTDEQVVGTWIDGKPIYQKTFELNYVCPSKNGWEVVQNNAIHNIDILISATTSYIYTSSYRYTNATTVRVDEPSGNLTIYVTGDQMSGNILKQITIQYTKTTDT